MRYESIPILSYHKIEPKGDIGITTRHPEQFSRDMELLKSLGFHTITFKDLQNPEKIPINPVIITFDDGYQSVYNYAMPVMKSFGFRGVIFIPVKFIGRTNDWDVQLKGKKYSHLNYDQLTELHHNHFEIGSHTISHCDLTSQGGERLHAEIIGSKEKLQNLLRSEVISLCYPFGLFNRQVMDSVREAGYQFGVASVHFNGNEDGYGPFSLRKFNIYRMDTSENFIRKLKFNFNSPLAYRDWLIQLGGRATVLYQRFIKNGSLSGQDTNGRN